MQTSVQQLFEIICGKDMKINNKKTKGKKKGKKKKAFKTVDNVDISSTGEKIKSKGKSKKADLKKSVYGSEMQEGWKAKYPSLYMSAMGKTPPKERKQKVYYDDKEIDLV